MKRFSHAVLLSSFALITGCSTGGGCGMDPIPGGFPSSQRTANAGQMRVSQTGLASITDDPAALIAGFLGDGSGLSFEIPPNCGGTPEICCNNGVPVTPCGPLVIDLVEQVGDAPRLELSPIQGASRLDVTMRARLRTQGDIQVGLFGISCGLRLDTMPGSFQDVRVEMPINLTQDPQAGTTRIEAGTPDLLQLEGSDFSLHGSDFLSDLACQGADALLSGSISSLTGVFADQLSGFISEPTCKSCPSGDVNECGPFANACQDNVCMKPNDTCLQELGIAGRMRGTTTFGGFSPGTTGAMDLYEVAGGYATTNNNGLALGLLGGMAPAGVARDRCGPAATPPAAVTIPQSSFFQGNTRPDTGAPFDVAIGLHKSQLEDFAYSAYDGGLLCLTITSSVIDLLTSDTLALIAPSVGNLVAETSPVAVGLRPQSPPSLVLGRNTFVDNGGTLELDEPLLDITFDNLEIDFFAGVEGQYIRLFTLVTDLHMPIGLQPGPEGLVPVLGDVGDAFTNLEFKNSTAILETPEQLAVVFPTLLDIALPQIGGALAPIALPDLGGLRLDVTDVTAVDNVSFLAIFANLVPVTMARAHTDAALVSMAEPANEVLLDPARWSDAQRPSAELVMRGQGLEWSVRVDGGFWSPWSASPRRHISPPSFWLPGVHKVEVSARLAGKAATADRTPMVFKVPVGTAALPEVKAYNGEGSGHGFHGEAGEGCTCASSNPMAALPMALMIAGLAWARRRRRAARRRSWLGVLALGIVLFAGPGCSCGSDAPCGDVDCLPGDVERGAVGKFNGIATDGDRVVVSTYDQAMGDLVIVEYGGETPTYTAVDGVPDETPTHDPSTYRGGIEGLGVNVGAWTSIALNNGEAVVSYQDRDAEDLRVAVEHEGEWRTMLVDGNDRAGIHTSLAIAGGVPVVAYLATAVPAGNQRNTQLRLARAHSAAPTGPSDWTITVVATSTASCSGACGSGEACVEPQNPGEPETCVTPSAGCGDGCGDGDACVAGACRAMIEPVFVDHPTGAGLFVKLGVLPDGRLTLVYYDRNRTALILQVENSPGSSTFSETVLDGAGATDRGMWASAFVDGSGTVHVAYQDAISDEVYYTTWNGGPGIIELVDDGVRAGDRTHSVGAGATMFVDNTGPAIAYQDGATADLIVARRGDGWAATSGATGPLLDGFYVAAAVANGVAWLAWDQLDHARFNQIGAVTGLMVQQQ